MFVLTVASLLPPPVGEVEVVVHQGPTEPAVLKDRVEEGLEGGGVMMMMVVVMMVVMMVMMMVMMVVVVMISVKITLNLCRQ